MTNPKRAVWWRPVCFIAVVGVILAFFAFQIGVFDPGHSVEVENLSGQSITWLKFNYPNGSLQFANIPPGEKRHSSFTRQTGWGVLGVEGALADGTKISGTIRTFMFPNMPRIEVSFSVGNDGSVKVHSPQ